MNIIRDYPNLICGSGCTVCISSERTVYSFGVNEFGKLGHKEISIENEKESIINPPKQIKNLSNISKIGCGDSHTIVLDYDGNVFTFGSNEFGQLGTCKTFDELSHSYIPLKLNIPPIDHISCGLKFNICKTNDNVLYSFGANEYGQLCNGTYNDSAVPTLIPNVIDVDLFCCGGNHVIYKNSQNELYSWGDGYYGQLGNGSNEAATFPCKIENSPDNIISIKCGDFYSILLTREGKLYGFGDNNFGQLGKINEPDIECYNTIQLIDNLPLIKKVECGYEHVLCIDIDDHLWVFGTSESGQLGLGNTENKFIPEQVKSVSEIIDISSGGNHTIIKTVNNDLYGFGFNDIGQIGKTTTNQLILSPIRVLQDYEHIWGLSQQNLVSHQQETKHN